MSKKDTGKSADKLLALPNSHYISWLCFWQKICAKSDDSPEQ